MEPTPPCYPCLPISLAVPVDVIAAIAPVGINDPSNVIPWPLVNNTPSPAVAVPFVSIYAVPLVHWTSK